MIFPKIVKVGNVGIFVLLKYENKLDVVIRHIKFTLKIIQLTTLPNLFPLEVVQKCQHNQLWVLRENSINLAMHENRTAECHVQ